MALWDTTDWTIAERVKPKMRGQSISQNMLKDMYNAWPMLLRSGARTGAEARTGYVPRTGAEARTGARPVPTINEVHRVNKAASLSVVVAYL